MEYFNLDSDSIVFCVTATTFPEGVLAAHKTLHSFISHDPNRKYYGISYSDKKGKIVYKAAATELITNELRKHSLELFTIKKGAYICITVINFRNAIHKIGDSFASLLLHPDIDPNGYCLEWYFNQEDCKCMVKLK